MVFMGKGRGRGGNQFVSKSSGIISATTRKEKRPAENYEKEERDRSRSPMSKRPVLERLGPQREEMSPSHESLRITVGNDIYKERQSRSPLSERLGPPVKGQFDEMKYHTDERYDELYGGEAEPKQGHHRRDRYDNPRSPRSHDRVGRSDSYDRKKSDSYDHGKRSDSYDREWKSSSYDRSRRSSSRDRGRRDHDRNRRDSYDRHGERDKRDGNKDSRGYLDDHDRGISHSERHLSDLDGGFPRQEDNLLQSEQVKRYQESSFSGGYSSLAGSGETKPLKSILKKSAPDPPAYTSDKAAPTFPSEMHPNRPLSYEPPKAGAPIMRSAKKTSSKSFSGLPGMSSYMDIEDEERFLYGDDSEEKYKKESKSYYEDKEHDSYRSENRQSSYKNDDGPPQIETYSGGYQAGDRYQSEELSDYPRTSEIPQQQPRRDSTDLLSIFTSHRGQTIPTVTAPYSTQQNTLPTEEKKAKYDPTIENILKSIGFDFEMSKRMQEKANPVPSKPKEEIQYGIDQASSFLGGELAEDIKKEIFPVKSRKESMVDVLLREAKLTSSPASKQKTSIPTLDRRDSTTKRERSYERESSYQDDASVPSQPISVASSQPISPSYTPSSSYAAAVTYPVSTVPTTYGLTSTAASSYPPSSSYQAPGFTTYAPPTPYSGPPPYGMPPPGHPSMWGPPPGHPAYATRFMAPSPYGPPPGYPPGYPPYGPPPTSGTSVDTPKLKDNVTKPKMYSNLKSVELSKKVDDAPSKKTETKTVTVVKKTSKKTDSKGKSKGNVASLTTKSSNRTVLPPKNRTPVKSPAEKTMTTIVKNDKDKLIITKVILTSKEKEKLVKEKEQTQQRLKILEQELSSLRKQQNELMRKRRRQKDGHKDPILMQNSILQEEITKQIAKLRQEVDEKAKLISEASVEDAGSSTPKRSRELSSSRQSPTVSASPAKKPRTEKSSNDRRRSSDRRQNERPRDKSRTETDKKKDEASIKDREKRDDRRSSSAARQAAEKPKEKTAVETQTSNIEGTPNQTEKDTFKPIKPERKVRYEFFDPGNHWCRTCNVVCSSLTSMLQHLHGKKHQGLVNKYDRPWMPEELKSGVPNEKPISKDDLKVEVTPIKGSAADIFFVQPLYCHLYSVLYLCQ